MSSLKLERCEHTQRRVTPLAIVEDLEVFEDRTGQFDACAPALPIEQFDLHATPERFHHRVVVAVANRTHRRKQPGVDGATSERPRRELPRLNRSSQHWLVGRIVDVRQALLPVSSNSVFYAGVC